MERDGVNKEGLNWIPAGGKGKPQGPLKLEEQGAERLQLQRLVEERGALRRETKTYRANGSVFLKTEVRTRAPDGRIRWRQLHDWKADGRWNAFGRPEAERLEDLRRIMGKESWREVAPCARG